jgi:hypothetical protein
MLLEEILRALGLEVFHGGRHYTRKHLTGQA